MIVLRVTVESEAGTVHEATFDAFMSCVYCIFLPGMVLPDSDLKWILCWFPPWNPALNTNLFLLTNPSFPNSTRPSKNPIPTMELHALTTGITNKGWSTWSSSSVCFFVVFMTLGLPGGHLLPGIMSVVLTAA